MPERLVRFFRYAHWPKPPADASRLFCELAFRVTMTFPLTSERMVCLRLIPNTRRR
jgi:hypothetical protein